MAMFAIRVHMERPLPTFLLSQNPREKKASAWIYTTIIALIADSQRLVSQAVTSACNKDLRSADKQIQAAARERLRLLATWQKLKYPFSWQQPGEKDHSTYALLVKILNSSYDRDATSLIQSEKRLSYMGLAQHLLKIGLAEVSHPSAPLLKNGICPMALRATAKMTLDTLDESTTHQLWAHGLAKSRIDFLPWHKNGTRGAKSTTHNCWIFIDRAPAGASQQHEGGAAMQIAKSTAAQDPTAPWTIPPDICEMGALWEKTILPKDWKLESATLIGGDKANYVLECYQWVEANFDGKKTHHRLGLVIAIMFSRLLPEIVHPKELDDGPGSPTEKIRRLPWISPGPKHKGFTQTGPFLTMMSTTIILLLDSESPLRRYLKENDNCLGDPWTKKHGELMIIL